MDLFFASLNSGSNGNAYYIGSEKEAVLVDAGISCREIEKRMKSLSLEMHNLRAVFISHEHADHIKGLAVLAHKYAIPVYVSARTRKELHLKLPREQVFHFENEQPVSLGDIRVLPFDKHHDAVDPYSFIVSYREHHIGVFTDIGQPCEKLIHYFGQCHAAFLESNYDEEMLERGNYPQVLKKRIRGGKGHLSNRQALELFEKHRPPHLSHLLLSHLSQHNNRPELAMAGFESHLSSGIQISVAPRYQASAVFSVAKQCPVPLSVYRAKIPGNQLSLF